MTILETLLSPWHALLRWMDIRELWYGVKMQAIAQDRTLDEAKAAFMFHCMHDPAWLCLGEEEIVRRIDALK